MNLYMVFYTDKDIDKRVNEVVVGISNAIDYATNLAKSDQCSFVTLHNITISSSKWDKGTVYSGELIYTFDRNDEHSVALAKEQNVPCLNI